MKNSMKLQITNYKLQILTAILLGSLLRTASAQTAKDTGKFSFSLKQCIDYAMQNQTSMKNATLEEAIAASKVKEITGIGLPQINTSAQLSNNDPLRRMFTAGDGVHPNFLAGGQVIPKGEVIAVPNVFQLKAGGDVGATITQLIFSSSYFIGLKAAKTYKELSAKSTQLTKIQVTEGVTKAYYLVLINEERIKLFDKNVIRIDSMLKQTQVMHTNGFVEKIDVDRIEVAYNNLQTEREKFNNLLAMSKLLLKYQMSMPLGADLSLTEKMADYKSVVSPPDATQKPNFSARIEYSLLESQKKLQLLDIKNHKLACLPRIAAFANAGWFSQSPTFNYFSEKNLWYNYGMYGLSLNLPIFDGLQNARQTQQSKLKLQELDNNIASLEQSIELQMRTSEISLKNGLSSLAAQNKNMELASEVAQVTKAKYKQGVGTSLEVTSAETSLLESQTNYYNALYDVLISKVDYDKATGTIK